MTTTALRITRSRTISRELFLWWLHPRSFRGGRAAASGKPRPRTGRAAGPLPAAAPSDQPPPSPRASAPAEIGGKPNFSGTWALNKDESDDPRETMQQAGNSGGHQVGQGGGGGRVASAWAACGGGMGGGGGWGGRGGGGQGAGGGRRGGQEGSGNAMNDLSQLTIEQTASSAKVTGESGARARALFSRRFLARKSIHRIVVEPVEQLIDSSCRQRFEWIERSHRQRQRQRSSGRAVARHAARRGHAGQARRQQHHAHVRIVS